MSGFPATPTRTAFGPEMKNKRTPRNPETDLNANQMNLLFWQVAGAGRTVAQASLVYDGAAPGVTYQALAFDPKQELGNIAVVKNGVGDYVFTFASTYLNQNGVATPFVPGMAMVSLQNPVVNDSVQFSIAGQSVTVNVRDAAGTLKDGVVQLQVWGN